MIRAVLVRLILLVFLLSAASAAPATAHYKDAKIEIYRAITSPVIDGTYNMTLREVDNDGVRKLVDEWNDASWIEMPVSNRGGLIVYSAYKYVMNSEEDALYVASDFVSVTTGTASAGTCFDPRHDGGVFSDVQDDFKIRYSLGEEGDLSLEVGYPYVKSSGSSKGLYTRWEAAPENLNAAFDMSVSPFSSIPHVFIEIKVPLDFGKLDRYLDSTIGMAQFAYGGGEESLYPMRGGPVIAPEYADASFAKTTNPDLSVPPTLVPEFPIQAAPLVAVTALVAAVMILRKASRVVRRTGP